MPGFYLINCLSERGKSVIKAGTVRVYIYANMCENLNAQIAFSFVVYSRLISSNERQVCYARAVTDLPEVPGYSAKLRLQPELDVKLLSFSIAGGVRAWRKRHVDVQFRGSRRGFPCFILVMPCGGLSHLQIFRLLNIYRLRLRPRARYLHS